MGTNVLDEMETIRRERRKAYVDLVRAVASEPESTPWPISAQDLEDLLTTLKLEGSHLRADIQRLRDRHQAAAQIAAGDSELKAAEPLREEYQTALAAHEERVKRIQAELQAELAKRSQIAQINFDYSHAKRAVNERLESAKTLLLDTADPAITAQINRLKHEHDLVYSQWAEMSLRPDRQRYEKEIDELSEQLASIGNRMGGLESSKLVPENANLALSPVVTVVPRPAPIAMPTVRSAIR